MEKNTMKKRKLTIEEGLYLLLAGTALLALILYVSFCLDNLMHSDTTAEVILSKFLADRNELISKEWFYSTEIRVIYTQLVMVPLFKIFSSYRLVKLLSVFIYYAVLLYAWHMLTKRFTLEKKWIFLGLALLLAPLSNEYLDMMFIGCFYTTQTICMYLVLSFVLKEKKNRKMWIREGIVLSILSVLLGMTGLRYLASLYLPMLLAFLLFPVLERDGNKKENWQNITFSLLLTGFAGIGFLINKFYLAVQYSFDTTSEVSFVPIDEIPDRFLTSIRLMLEFMGYRQIRVVTPLGIVNAVKCLFFLAFIAMIVALFRKRMELTGKERFLLYFFLMLFLINWYMLIFTDVLQQYRYWLPVYVTGVVLICVFMQHFRPATVFQKPLLCAFLALVVLSSLYGELWQDVKYNDCAKRYAYMDFLENNDYDFGYATFWNASVTEYLSNGTIHVGNLGGSDGKAAPYEWLTPKEYYRSGFHHGKCFLLLARTEEAGMLKGDFTVMDDAACVYQDEYYAIYEGQQDMYLFSKGYEPK